MKKFWSTLVDQTCENFGWSEKVGKKTSFFHEALKVEGVFTCNRFVSMIRCPKHFGGTCFHPNSLMSSYLVNWRKFFCCWNFDIFHFFWPFLPIFSLLKIAVNKSSAIFTNVQSGIFPALQDIILFFLKTRWSCERNSYFQ